MASEHIWDIALSYQCPRKYMFMCFFVDNDNGIAINPQMVFWLTHLMMMFFCSNNYYYYYLYEVLLL